ncbi:polysaccharide pyruvyl transferase family protein [Clostridium sp. Marseille-P2415]|uniref:polysaccharide pyruvyl transferase family protein n=1 Tax=Clostridium sp. Marseille-P2415 TaxID=1805471 RepID=UPI00098894F2|nr:polysaccharide pyruvyl transferase family protein [Clostridium sp. Marseille-P2415]
MKIGLLGLIFRASNKGCEALSYAFLSIVDEIAAKRNEKIEIKILSTFPTKKFLKAKGNYRTCMDEFLPRYTYENLNIGFCFFKMVCGKYIVSPGVKECDVVFDFTAGDSFTDIYGRQRFFVRTALKQKVIDMGIPLVLGSQTIGPFQDKDVRDMAVKVIHGCKEVYARDQLSVDYTVKISGRKPVLTTDVAFALPYTKNEHKNHIVNIGFNPSGLLWNGGYTGDNQFGLTVDYQKYCREVIQNLIKKYEVYLIPHVLTDLTQSMDNDLFAIRELKKEFPSLVVIDDFITPMEVKSYIARLDGFIGARMHATIAAFSANVACVPFSYSRKFEGLFDSLGYARVIHGCSDTTDEAIEKTLDWIEKHAELQKEVIQCNALATEKTNELKDNLQNLLYGGL